MSLNIAFSLWAGYEVTSFFVKNEWDLITRLFASFPIAILYQSLLSMVLQVFFPWGTIIRIIDILFFGIVSLVFHYLNRKRVLSKVVSFSVFELIVLIISSIYVSTRLIFVYFQNGMNTRGWAWADLSFHLQIITSFSYGCNSNRSTLFGLRTPFRNDINFAYPLLPDFHSSFLISSCRMSLINSMRYTSVLMGISTIFLIYSLTKTLTGSSVAVLSVPLWIFSGGLGFLQVFDEKFGSLKGHTDYIYDFYGEQHGFWFQSLTNLINPQRCALFAVPLCITTLLSLISGVSKWDWNFFAFAAINLGVMPQTQAHAYLSTAIFSVSFFMISFPFTSKIKMKALMCWLVFGFFGNLLALPLSWPMLNRVGNKGDFITWNSIWANVQYTKPPHRMFRLWWPSLGVYGAIALCGGFITITKKVFKVYVSSLVVFFAANMFSFQFWVLDNAKIFHNSFFPISLSVVVLFFEFSWNYLHKYYRFILSLLFISCNISGLLSHIITEGHKISLTPPFFSQTGDWSLENLPTCALFQNSKTVWLPTTVLSGKHVYYGYDNTVNTHSISNASEKMIASELELGNNNELNFRYNVLFSISSVDNPSNYGVHPWWEPIYTNSYYTIWKFVNHHFANTTTNREKTEARGKSRYRTLTK